MGTQWNNENRGTGFVYMHLGLGSGGDKARQRNLHQERSF